MHLLNEIKLLRKRETKVTKFTSFNEKIATKTRIIF